MSEEQRIINLLFINDKDSDYSHFLELLQQKNLKIYHSHNYTEARTFLVQKKIDIVISDYLIGNTHALQELKKVKKSQTSFFTMLITDEIIDDEDPHFKEIDQLTDSIIQSNASCNLFLSKLETMLKMVEILHESHKQNKQVIEALVISFKHEILNPLSIVLGYEKKLKSIFKKYDPEAQHIMDIIETNLNRITSFVKRLDYHKEFEFKKYTENSLMLKLDESED